MKNEQLLTYDATLFNIPNQNNTPLAIAVKFYVMNRIQEIKLHHITPVITFVKKERKKMIKIIIKKYCLGLAWRMGDF